MYLSKNCVVILVILFCLEVRGQLEEGDDCSTANGDNGVCTFLTQCRAAVEGIKRKEFPRDICGFVGTQVIVCCIDTPTTTTTRRTTTTTRKPTTTTTTTRKPTTTTTTTTTSRPNLRRPGDMANQKCEEYDDYAYERKVSDSLSLIETYTKILNCPISTEQLIVGGTKAKRNEFPHQIQIGYIDQGSTQWSCGGSLISETFILTAAHCLENANGEEAKLLRGGIATQTDTDHLQVRSVIERIKYPTYNIEKYDDIALLRANESFVLNIYLRPGCLQTIKNIETKHAIASGWGLTEYAGEGSKELLRVTLEFFTAAKCNNTYRRQIAKENSDISRGIVDDIMLCAGSTEDIKDTCQGDSGGPLQTTILDTKEIKCSYKIVGVTSFGIGCGLAKNIPGVYTRVSGYIKWIEDIVWPN